MGTVFTVYFANILLYQLREEIRSAAAARDGSEQCHLGFTRARIADRMCGRQAGSSSNTKMRVN
jgi:hypothetical protein